MPTSALKTAGFFNEKEDEDDAGTITRIDSRRSRSGRRGARRNEVCWPIARPANTPYRRESTGVAAPSVRKERRYGHSKAYAESRVALPT